MDGQQMKHLTGQDQQEQKWRGAGGTRVSREGAVSFVLGSDGCGEEHKGLLPSTLVERIP